MDKLKAALFDLDGTLMDTEGQYTEFWGSIARQYRPDVPALEQKIKGTTLTQIFSTYFPQADIQADITRRLDAWEGQMHYEFVDGATGFLHDLKEHGVKCVLVTSSNRKKMDSVRRQIPQFDSLFFRVLTSEDFTLSKPHPDPYLAAARAAGASVAECVAFEDAFTGLASAMAANIYTIGVASSNPPHLIEDKCDHVITSFGHMDYATLMQIINTPTSTPTPEP